jgi:hypothetical protein
MRLSISAKSSADTIPASRSSSQMRTHVYWLLERHPEAAAKIGVGVKEISTRKAMFDTML